MKGVIVGAIAGVVLAFAALMFSFWGFLLVLVLGAVGGFIGALVSGRVNVRALTDALRGRRSA